MLTWHRTAVLLLLGTSALRAQLTIENPRKLDAPEPQIQALFRNITRVVESEFHSPGALEDKFRVRLVLGQAKERFTIDDPQGNGTVYLGNWNEGKFAVSTMRLAIQHLLGPDRQKKMLEEIVRRTRETAPVSAAQLRKEGIPVTPPDAFPSPDACVAGIANAPLRGNSCSPIRPVPIR